MGKFRDLMERDLKIRGYSEKTQQTYLRHVRDLVSYFNLPPDQLTLDQINVFQRHLTEERRLAYRARWEIELLFKAWKSEFRLDELPSRKPEVVEALIYAAVITMLVSRRLHALLRARVGRRARRVTAGRVAALVRQLASDLLLVIAARQYDRLLEREISRLLLHEAVAPHLRRIGLLERASGISLEAA